jgi:hypothetical protein
MVKKEKLTEKTFVRLNRSQKKELQSHLLEKNITCSQFLREVIAKGLIPA